MRFALALFVICVACGDNVTREVPYDATSGTRLRVERYLFDDGTTQPAPGGFFDADLHVRCTPGTWIDGTIRCLPIAEDALFADAACTTAIGRGMLITKPRAFVGREVVAGVSLPSHIYRAGAPIAAPGQYYERTDGMCDGPFFTPSDYVYYQLDGEVDPVAITETEVGTGRLVLRVRTTADGASTPLAIFDRELATDCEPAELDGTEVCEPTGAPISTFFADGACTQPAVAIPSTTTPQPLVARLEQPGDCPTYRAIDVELTTPVYRLDRGGCIGAVRDPTRRYFAVGELATLAPIERTIEASHRRLQRVLIAADDLFTYGTPLVDNATQAECARVLVGDVERCLPTNTLVATDVYAPGCVQRLRVTPAPIRACRPSAFAVSSTAPIELAALGDVTTETVYRFGINGACIPFTPPADQQLRTLGPALPEDTFLAARPFGER